jgi:hypothetical protein
MVTWRIPWASISFVTSRWGTGRATPLRLPLAEFHAGTARGWPLSAVRARVVGPGGGALFAHVTLRPGLVYIVEV